MGLPCPWQFWQIRDSRTLLSTHGDPRDKNKAGLHNALEDCVSQAQAVQTVFEQCGIKLDKLGVNKKNHAISAFNRAFEQGRNDFNRNIDWFKSLIGIN